MIYDVNSYKIFLWMTILRFYIINREILGEEYLKESFDIFKNSFNGLFWSNFTCCTFYIFCKIKFYINFSDLMQ